MKYRLGCYNTDGSLEHLRTVDKTCIQTSERGIRVYNLGSEDRVC